MRIIAIIAALALLIGCQTPKQFTVQERADEVVKLLSQHDFKTLSTYVNARTPLTFSPYATINPKTAQSFRREELAAAYASDQLRTWGTYDGSGEEIRLRFDAYVKKFVYDVDFVHAEKVSLDVQVGKGNSPSNIELIYPAAKFVEYHFSGFDPKLEGMDWRSLRLVFEKSNGVWWLVAIIHDQWTI